MIDIKNIDWQPVKHFLNGKEIPGAPKALVPGLGGWVIIMPNYWYGFVVVPVPDDANLAKELQELKEIRWTTAPLPIPEPDGTGEYGIPPGEWAPMGKRGLVPSGELVYLNQQTVFVAAKS